MGSMEGQEMTLGCLKHDNGELEQTKENMKILNNRRT